ncbi:MAG TPA: GvpL/GvpF family gas vesicle protein, partial [Gemmatimonadaceae bacterium]|nr:GvpL/GvpF family gas vesicle protein [Gemmatimonadaceae bacterium]
MSSNDSDALWYVYGIVSATAPAPSAPAGLDDAPVALERHNGVAALVSLLPGTDYDPRRLEEQSGDLEWLSPRAMAHDRVLTGASDRGPVVPLPMFSLFSGRNAVQAMLAERHDQVRSVLLRLGSAREYALRVYRVDAEMLGAVVELSPRLSELAASAREAAPGQRYLLDRKLDAERKAEMRLITQRIADEITTELKQFARDGGVVRSPVPRMSAGDAAVDRGTMVLNVAFLVDPESLQRFQSVLTTLVQRYTSRGFRFDFTGPWPPY